MIFNKLLSVRRISYMALFVFLSSPMFSQEEWQGRTLYSAVDTMPSFENGERGLMEYLSKNIKYPTKAREKGIMGTVIASYIIDENGQVLEPVIKSGIGYGCDEEVLRIIREMPEKWNPGIKNGKRVPVRMTLPVKFRL
ncbi:MAG: energy transducer TonB [Saprospiraceae bacterium]|jgi:protein TonB|nr:energy transducer TonB [Saprospiraceae bacterium]